MSGAGMQKDVLYEGKLQLLPCAGFSLCGSKARIEAEKWGYFIFCLPFVLNSRLLAELTVLGKIRR